MHPAMAKLIAMVVLFAITVLALYVIKRSKWQADNKVGDQSEKPTLLKEAKEFFEFLNTPKK